MIRFRGYIGYSKHSIKETEEEKGISVILNKWISFIFYLFLKSFFFDNKFIFLLKNMHTYKII